MTLNFTDLALAIIVIFGLVGWLRGARRAIFTTFCIFFSMITVIFISPDLIRVLARLGIVFTPSTNSDLFKTALFLFTVCIAQLGTSRLIVGQSGGPTTRRQRLIGFCLGLFNGFLIVANVVRYADPYLRTIVDHRTGGWTWHLTLPYVDRTGGQAITLGFRDSSLTITPSPVLTIYNTLPTALILLFAFLIVVFVGTVYGRVFRRNS